MLSGDYCFLLFSRCMRRARKNRVIAQKDCRRTLGFNNDWWTHRSESVFNIPFSGILHVKVEQLLPENHVRCSVFRERGRARHFEIVVWVFQNRSKLVRRITMLTACPIRLSRRLTWSWKKRRWWIFPCRDCDWLPRRKSEHGESGSHFCNCSGENCLGNCSRCNEQGCFQHRWHLSW